MKSRVIIGIDEVGRGPIAGPVTVGACQLNVSHRELQKRIKQTELPLRDSKKLTAKQREEWFRIIKDWQKEGVCITVTSSVSVDVIDRIGIAPAIARALHTCLKKLALDPSTCTVMLDGGLKAPLEYTHQQTIIKGDESELAISLASIVAKVTRDRYMKKMSTIHAVYGFERHVGYGTRAHYVSIEQYGVCPLHRRSFLKNILIK